MPTSAAMAPLIDVLLVEDSPPQRVYFESVLRGGGYKFRSADGVQSALEMLRTRRFRLLVADAGLGQESACALIRMVRAHHGIRNLPIIGISADQEQAEVLLRCGADAFLTKPFVGSQLLAAIPPLLMRGRPVRGVRLDKPAV